MAIIATNCPDQRATKIVRLENWADAVIVLGMETEVEKITKKGGNISERKEDTAV